MNRCFLLQDLSDPSLCNREQSRAKQLDALLGPKASSNPAADFIIDLHNTTSACGIALMMAHDDHFSHEVAFCSPPFSSRFPTTTLAPLPPPAPPTASLCSSSHLHLQVAIHLQSIDPAIRIVQWSPSPDHSLLPSIARSGMTFEVGPAPCGCLVASLYLATRKLVLAALDFIELHNEKVLRPLPQCASERTPLSPAPSVHAPCSSDDLAPAAKHARVASVPATVFCRVCSVDYLRGADGSLRAMIHPQLQGNDFVELAEGAPLFMGLDGSTVRMSCA
jgi:aspartoacylase